MTVEHKTSLLIDDLIKTNKIVNGYVFYGSDATILRKTSFYLVEQFFSQDSPITLNEENITNIPDLLYFSTEASSIKVDDIQFIQNRIKYGPSVYKRLFVIIDQADLLTVQAANAFLKTLEEPLDNISFLLLTTRFKQLIPTIRSRCQHLYIGENQEFKLDFKFDDPTTNTLDLLSFSDFIQLDQLDKFNHIEIIAKDKPIAKQQIDYWIKTAFEKHHNDFVFKLLDIRNRLEFNVNVRLQLEQLIL
ncbi:MAG: hypothetical protein CMP39_01740 [Rickettsiales bacterium]|nr:hypothetical protein [Rickettsiales bacterium]|tara:strand:+ start:7364 stop:8104 length:741 start_codon:yes stop_codon:yes gene_type:complete